MNGENHERRRTWLHVLLFAVTFATTTAAGAWQAGVDLLSEPAGLMSGLPFSVTLMSILLVHEMGHYLTSRYHGVKATLPFFIPGPSFIGTFGAFIKMQSQMPDRRSLFDIGAAGPLAGLALSVPAVIFGLHLSAVETIPSSASDIAVGSSLLFGFLVRLAFGSFPEAGFTLHPVAAAGWVGLLVTALNLLPAGQLDGGHVTYALFGRRYIWISRLTVVTILTLGIMRLWDGWLVWGALLLFMGMRHPPPLDPETPLDPIRKFIGWFLLATLALTFTPVPFSPPDSEPREERRRPEGREQLQRTEGREVIHERAA